MPCYEVCNSQRNMDKVPDLLAMTFLDSENAGNIALGRKKLAYAVNPFVPNWELHWERMG